MDRVELLRRISIFEGLTDDDLASLASHLEERRLHAGETVFRLGDSGNELFIVGEGHINIFLPGENSRRLSLKDLASGEYFGELALFDDKPRSASAFATTKTVLFALGRKPLWDFLESSPRAALPILRTISDRLRDTNVLLSDRAARNAIRDVEQHWTLGQRFADAVAEANGSWACVIGLVLLTIGWMIANTRAVLPHPFDEYPYVFYNLVLAILVALQGPLIVMSQNRQAEKDRAQANADYLVNLKNEVHIETILRELGEFRAETVEAFEGKDRA